MKNKFLSILLIALFLSANTGFAGEINAVSKNSSQDKNIYDIGNLVDDIDYPDAAKVAPAINDLQTLDVTEHKLLIPKSIDI